MVTRIRTIDQAYIDIKSDDNNSSISRNYLRHLCKNGDIPTLKAGAKTLIDMDVLESYLNLKTNI